MQAMQGSKGENVSLSIDTSKDADRAVVSAIGEIDVSNASALRDALDQALADGAKVVACDLAQVPYIDSTGIGVLVGAAHRCKEAGSELDVLHPQKNVERVFELLGVTGELNIQR